MAGTLVGGLGWLIGLWLISSMLAGSLCSLMPFPDKGFKGTGVFGHSLTLTPTG